MYIGAYTPQNVCLLCNLVRFGLHFLRTFSEANIYEYLSSIFFANFSVCGRPFLYLWGAFFGFPPPPPNKTFCVRSRIYDGIAAHWTKVWRLMPPPPKILIKLHVWSIYLIKFPHLLSIRGACTPEKLFLGGAI